MWLVLRVLCCVQVERQAEMAVQVNRDSRAQRARQERLAHQQEQKKNLQKYEYFDVVSSNRTEKKDTFSCRGHGVMLICWILLVSFLSNAFYLVSLNFVCFSVYLCSVTMAV